MKLGRVVSLSEYKAERLMRNRGAGEIGVVKTHPDEVHLWELLDRNMSLGAWKKGT